MHAYRAQIRNGQQIQRMYSTIHAVFASSRPPPTTPYHNMLQYARSFLFSYFHRLLFFPYFFSFFLPPLNYFAGANTFTSLAPFTNHSLLLSSSLLFLTSLLLFLSSSAVLILSPSASSTSRHPSRLYPIFDTSPSSCYAVFKAPRLCSFSSSSRQSSSSTTTTTGRDTPEIAARLHSSRWLVSSFGTQRTGRHFRQHRRRPLRPLLAVLVFPASPRI